MSIRLNAARCALVALVTGLALHAGLEAAPRQGGPPPGEAEIRHAVERVMISKLREVLQLTPEQEDSVLPLVQELIEARRQFASRRRARMAYLQAAMLDEEADERAIEEALADVREVERGFREREDELRRRIGAGLTPRQEARMLFFERHFRRVMQRRVRELMRERAGARHEGARPRGGPRDPEREGPFGAEDPFSDLEDWGEE